MVGARPLGRLSWCWILILYLVVLAQAAEAKEPVDILWNFATHLYQEKDYYRALTEYQRFVFLFPNDPRVSEAELQIGRCYRREGRPNKAFGYFFGLYNRKAETVGREALLEMVAIRQEQSRYPEAIYWTRKFIELYSDYAEIDNIYLSLAWLQIDSGKYDEAIASLDLIQPDSAYYSRAKSISQALQRRPEKTEKSPQTAGVLAAMLPGAGHLYVGRPKQAISSFLLNAVFISGAVVAFKNDSPVLGSILVFFELGWYGGGIHSAVEAARQENRQRERRYRRELKEKYRLSIGLQPGKDSLALSLRLIF